mgnify:CR=1 FL=1
MRSIAIVLFAIASVLFFSSVAASADKTYAAAKPAVMTADKVNVRATPDSEKGAILGALSLNAKVTVHGESEDGKWYVIEYPAGISQYVYAKYVTKINDSEGEIGGSQVRVRVSPNVQAQVVRELGRGDKVGILGMRGNDWYRIKALPDSRCYVSREFVKMTAKIEPAPEAAPATAAAPAAETPSKVVEATTTASAEPAATVADPAVLEEIAARNKAREEALKKAEDTLKALGDRATPAIPAAVETNSGAAPTIAMTTPDATEPQLVAQGIVEVEENTKYSPFAYRLRRSGLTMYYLKSGADSIDLSSYIGKRCKLYGDVGTDLSKVTRKPTINIIKIEIEE